MQLGLSNREIGRLVVSLTQKLFAMPVERERYEAWLKAKEMEVKNDG